MKYINSLCLMCVCVCIALNLVSCGEIDKGENTPIAAIILLGNHANSKHFDDQLEATIQQVYSTFGNVGIVVVDGNPTLMRDDSTTGILGCYTADYLNESKKLFINNNDLWPSYYLIPQMDNIKPELKGCKADDPEVDTLSALYTAVEALNTIEGSMATSVEKEIIILDTGLCTSGALNFLVPEYQRLLNYEGKLWENESMDTEVSNMINQLEEQAEIPNLKGIRVTWYGLGQTSEPQATLSKIEIQNLQYIWGELLTKAGSLPSTKYGTDEKYGIFVSISTYGSIESDQYVTPVPLIPGDDDVSFPESKIEFCPNSDDYLSSDEDEIKEKLSPYTYLQNYSSKKILLIGTTSSWNGGSLKLAEKRAEKVKSSLINLGVPEECIVVKGVGYDLNFCKDDSPNGRFEETIAKENRSVLILVYDSSEAQKILSESE